jgi:uracil-DNA glycosylase
MNRDFAAHLDTLFSCRACPKMAGTPVTGVVFGARVMLVGQAPGVHEADRGRPFAYTAGKRLFSWLAEIGIEEEEFRKRVHITAVARCFPGKVAGGDRVPDADEIARCGVHLDRELRLNRPSLVIAVGTLASSQLVGISTLSQAVGRLHRATRAGVEFDVVVLPHPSGRSTWLNRPEHRALLQQSLKLIQGFCADIDDSAAEVGRRSTKRAPATMRGSV